MEIRKELIEEEHTGSDPSIDADLPLLHKGG